MTACALTNRRILVVEEEFFIATDLETALKAAQAIVLGPVSRVQAGLVLVRRQNQISAAILDVNLGSVVLSPERTKLGRLSVRRGPPRPAARDSG